MIELLLHRSPWRDGLEVLICERDHRDGITAVARALTLEKLPESERDNQLDPTMRLDGEAARRLMDELWRCGIRPSNGAGNVGQLAATEKHLEDMRTLVFKTTPAQDHSNG